MDWINRRHRSSKAAIFGILFCTVLFLTACGSDTGGPERDPQAAVRGEQVFIDNCGPCHGPGGRGPALAELQALSPADRSEKIRNHPTAGRIPQRLPANELINLIEFFASE